MCTNTPSVPPSREEEAIKLDGLSVAEMRGLRDKAEKHVFQAEVNRMMKLIINSLYRNKEVGEGGVASAVVHARLHIITVVKLMFLRLRNYQISCGTDGQFCAFFNHSQLAATVTSNPYIPTRDKSYLTSSLRFLPPSCSDFPKRTYIECIRCPGQDTIPRPH